MTEAEAKELLGLHAFSHPNLHHEKMDTGFLGSLRPYRGHLIEENFHEVMAALRVLAPLILSPSVDREIISHLWTLCHLSRLWAVNPEGMLQRNDLIEAEDVQKIQGWLDCIGETVMYLLEGGPIQDAFHEYDTNYKKSPPSAGDS